MFGAGVSSLASARASRCALPQSSVPVRHGSNLKELRGRIKSVHSIKKITSSMKMVAAAKSMSAKMKLNDVKPLGTTLAHAFVTREGAELVPDDDIKTHQIILITADRGLCGPINSQIVRKYRQEVKAHPEISHKAVLIGEKARGAMHKKEADQIVVSGVDLARKQTPFADTCEIVDQALAQSFDKLTLLFNKFVSALVFEPTFAEFPSRELFVRDGHKSFANHYDIDDSVTEILENLYSYWVASTVHAAIVENAAVELAARQNSMDNATKNADAMIKSLTLEYNKKRQAAITTELAEIVSGAEGLKKKE